MILDRINLVLLALVSFYISTNTPYMETSTLFLVLACFLELNKVHLHKVYHTLLA